MWSSSLVVFKLYSQEVLHLEQARQESFKIWGLWVFRPLLPLHLKSSTIFHVLSKFYKLLGQVFKRGFHWFKKQQLEFGNHWSSLNPSFYSWERPSIKWLVPGLKKLNICVIILSIYKKPFSCILTWEVYCILIHRVLLRSWFSLFSCHLVQSSTPKCRM